MPLIVLYSIIQIGPEVLNNITNVTSSSSPLLDYGILQGAATLLAGLLIFLTLGRRHYRLIYYTQQRGGGHKTFHVDKEGVILLITLIPLCIAIALALFAEFILAAKVSFVVSLVPLVVFIVFRLHSLEIQPDEES
jgi:hypothetical protein